MYQTNANAMLHVARKHTESQSWMHIIARIVKVLLSQISFSTILTDSCPDTHTSWPRRCCSLKLMWCSDHLKNILFSYWWQYMFSLQSPIRGIIGRGIFFKWLLHHISFNLRQHRSQLVYSTNFMAHITTSHIWLKVLVSLISIESYRWRLINLSKFWQSIRASFLHTKLSHEKAFIY